MRKTKRKRKMNHLGKARIKYYSIKKGGGSPRSRSNSNRLRTNTHRMITPRIASARKLEEASVMETKDAKRETKKAKREARRAARMARATRAAAAEAERMAAWEESEAAAAAEAEAEAEVEAAKALPKVQSKVTHIFPSYSDAYLANYNPEYGVSLPIPMTYDEWRNYHR